MLCCRNSRASLLDEASKLSRITASTGDNNFLCVPVFKRSLNHRGHRGRRGLTIVGDCLRSRLLYNSSSHRFSLITSLLDRKIEKRPDKVRLQGRILFLTEDPELIKRQLAGADLPWDSKNPANNPKLRDDISTDEITPAHYCFYFDETLGEIPYLGLKCGDVLPIGRGEVKKGGFICAVSGKRRGKGSSREQSPYAEMCAGIQLVIAENIERIYKQNCQNLGLLTSTDFSLIDKVRAEEEIPLSEFTAGEDEITRQVIEYGRFFTLKCRPPTKKFFPPPDHPANGADALGEKIFPPPHAGFQWGREHPR